MDTSSHAPSESPGRQIAYALATRLDGGEGWSHEDEAAIRWFPHRLSVTLRWFEGDNPSVSIEAPLVTGLKRTQKLLERLNAVNIAAAGWCATFEQSTGTVRLHSTLAVADTRDLGYMHTAARLAGAAELMAPRFAALGGIEVLSHHPVRGTRHTPDGWIAGQRVSTAAEGASALRNILTAAERARVGEAFSELLSATLAVESSEDLLRWVDGQERPVAVLQTQFHPELGYGLRLFVSYGHFTDPLVAAARLNQDMFQGTPTSSIMGAVVAQGSTLGFTAFIPATEVEALASGDLIRALRALVQRSLHMRKAAEDATAPTPVPDPAWTVLAPTPPSSAADLANEESYAPWSAPREAPLLTWMHFNPAGPTVSALYIAHTASELVLLHLYHHPMYPGGEVLASGSRQELLDTAERFAASPEEMFPGGLPTCLTSLDDRLLRSVEEGLRAVGRIEDLDFEAALLTTFAGDPWAMTQSANTLDHAVEDPDDSDPACRWVSAASDPEHVRGCTLALRSAWEASKAFANGDAAAASNTAQNISSVVARRVSGQHSTPAAGRTLPPVTWQEVRSAALGFLDANSSLVTVLRESHGEVDVAVSGVKVRIRAVPVELDTEEALLVQVSTDIAETTNPEMAATLVALFNREMPLSLFVLEESRISLRFQLRLASTGRSLFRLLAGAVVLQGEYARAARDAGFLRQSGEFTAVHDPELSTFSPHDQWSVFKTLFPDDSAWLPTWWPSVRESMTRTMIGLGWPIGWANHEVQYFCETPPDLAIACLDPENHRFAPLGRGATVIARVTEPSPELASIDPEFLNTANLSMLDLGGSALAPMRSDNGEMVGLRVEAWIPAGCIAPPTADNETMGVHLANTALHVAGAPFSLLER